MKLDIFNHIFPKTYWDKMLEVSPNMKDMENHFYLPIPLLLLLPTN